MVSRRAFFTPLNKLTPGEIIQLFQMDIPKSFMEKYGEYSIANFPDPRRLKERFELFRSIYTWMYSW